MDDDQIFLYSGLHLCCGKDLIKEYLATTVTSNGFWIMFIVSYYILYPNYSADQTLRKSKFFLKSLCRGNLKYNISTCNCGYNPFYLGFYIVKLVSQNTRSKQIKMFGHLGCEKIRKEVNCP